MTPPRIDLARVRARFEQSLAGEILDEIVRIEVIERSLALASKLFVAVIPLSISAGGRARFDRRMQQRSELSPCRTSSRAAAGPERARSCGPREGPL